jgi:lipopolysaccharide export system permease protein
MSYWQLKRYAKRAVKEGYDDTRHRVDLHSKIAFPFVMFIMSLMGIPLAMRFEKGGTPLEVAAGMALCFIYVVISGLSRSLGYAAILPPVLSAWLANCIFFFLAIYLMKGVRR